MSDLINRKDLGAAIDNWLTIDRYYHPYSKQKTIPVSELIDIIKLLPTTEPEIVRCNECKWYQTINLFGTKATVCKRMCCEVAEYEFCSRGERRDEND